MVASGSKLWEDAALVILILGILAWGFIDTGRQRRRLDVSHLDAEELRREVAAAGDSAAQVDPPGGTSNSLSASGLLDLNTATREELEALPVLGPKRAARIVERREEIGGFRSVDDLDGLYNIGPKGIEELGRYLTVAPLAGEAGLAGQTAGSGARFPAATTSPPPSSPRQTTAEPNPVLNDPTNATPGPAPLAAIPPAIQAPPPDTAPTWIDLNTASEQELQTLDGIGEKLARRIVIYRQAHPFRSPSEIMKVDGIGKKTWEKNAARLVVR